MNTNKTVIIGLFIFWAVVVALLISGFISYENRKLIESLQTNQERGVVGVVGQKEVEESMVLGGAEDASFLLEEIHMDLEYISAHNTEDDCWMVIEKKIYDVTEYIPLHPGGVSTIVDDCGSDATDGFKTKGKNKPVDHSSFAYSLLGNYFIADIGSSIQVKNIINRSDVVSKDSMEAVGENMPQEEADTTEGADSFTNAPPVTIESPADSTPVTPTVSTGIAMSDVSSHNTISSCWMVIDSKVYDFTSYVPLHPGGTNQIINNCGRDGSGAFASVGHSSYARGLLSNYYVGDLAFITNSNDTGDGGETTAVPNSTGYPAIDDRFPGAIVLKTEYEDDGRVKVDISHNGSTFEIKLNSNGNITKVED